MLNQKNGWIGFVEPDDSSSDDSSSDDSPQDNSVCPICGKPFDDCDYMCSLDDD